VFLLRRFGSVAGAILVLLAPLFVLGALTLTAWISGAMSQPNDGSPYPLWHLVVGIAVIVTFIIGPALVVGFVLYMREANNRSIIRWTSVAALGSSSFFFYMVPS
jgi:purine-cytosine permease-like protein